MKGLVNMKRLLSVLLAVTTSASLLGINAFAYNETPLMQSVQECNIVYGDDIQENVFTYSDLPYDITNYSTTANEDEYEPNDFENPYFLNGAINSTSNVSKTINASLSPTDVEDAYKFWTTGPNYPTMFVEELVVQISGLRSGDEIAIGVQNSNNDFVSGVAYGIYGSTAYITLPSSSEGMDTYTIYVGARNLADNSTLNYTLFAVSRYIHDEVQVYTSPSSLYNSGNTSYSSPATIRFSTSSVPRSAVVDKLLTQGTVTTNSNGRGTSAHVKIDKGSTTLYVYYGPVGFVENLTDQNLSLSGTWSVSFMPNSSAACTYSNISVKFYYTYDVLNV